jgi:hypothetical protein
MSQEDRYKLTSLTGLDTSNQSGKQAANTVANAVSKAETKVAEAKAKSEKLQAEDRDARAKRDATK